MCWFFFTYVLFHVRPRPYFFGLSRVLLYGIAYAHFAGSSAGGKQGPKIYKFR